MINNNDVYVLYLHTVGAGWEATLSPINSFQLLLLSDLGCHLPCLLPAATLFRCSVSVVRLYLEEC